MGLCKFSSQYTSGSFIVIDNAFFVEYLPQAEPDHIKTYLFGLHACAYSNETENTLENFSRALGLSEDRIMEGFMYWQETGLVQVVMKNPIEVRYLPIRENSGHMKKYKPEKYSDFNKMLESFLNDRIITPTEYNEYYHFIESNNFEQEAFLSIVRYCTNNKGSKIGYPYILTVARSFANDGLKSEKAVAQKLAELELATSEVKNVLKALGLKRDPDPEERKMYVKWTKSFGFEQNVILHVAKKTKGGGLAKLDNTLVKYFQNRLLTIEEIDNFSQMQEIFYEIARDVTRTIGVFYQNLDNVIQTYILEWNQKGYDKDALIAVANYCFKNSIRTLEGMNAVIDKFFNQGLVSVEAIDQHLGTIVEVDKKISAILETCGILRSVNSWDRDFYRTWTFSWGISDAIIIYVASESKGKMQPMTYMNKLLSSIYGQNLKTLEEAKRYIEQNKSIYEQKAAADTVNQAEIELKTQFAKNREQAILKAKQALEKAMKNKDFAELHKQQKELEFEIGKQKAQEKNTQNLENELKEIKKKKVVTLKELGLQESDFNPKFTCEKCSDTGLVNGKTCECFTKQLKGTSPQ